jgi:hypothetical protein
MARHVKFAIEGSDSLTLREGRALVKAAMAGRKSVGVADARRVESAVQKIALAIESCGVSRADAMRLLETSEEDVLATTCFHCGAPAMKATHGFDPRCYRHRDV